MWFQLYGFVNLQPYIIYMNSYSMFLEGLPGWIVNRDLGKYFDFS